MFDKWYDGSKDIAQKALRICTHVLDALKRYGKRNPIYQNNHHIRNERKQLASFVNYKLFSFIVVLD